jgi:predicted NAD/FAD-dependent oxidoreductase
MARAAVIGAGLAGLTAARTLADAGATVVVFEKSRGLGGRLATRRTAEGLAFDHGAPEVVGRAGGFDAFLAGAVAQGRAAPHGGAVVGAPGMNDIVRGLADGLDVRSGVAVEALRPRARGWAVAAEGGEEPFDVVIVTAPAPQAAALCAAAPALGRRAAAARMAPCWTLMAAWEGGTSAPPAAGAGGPLARVVPMADRPGRAPAPARWVVHAAPDWTAAHLERPAAEVAPVLLRALAAALGLPAAAAVHAVAHRWRYARTAQPVGETHLGADGLFLAGDWLLGADAADAWQSGRAAAAAALDRLG